MPQVGVAQVVVAVVHRVHHSGNKLLHRTGSMIRPSTPTSLAFDSTDVRMLTGRRRGTHV